METFNFDSIAQAYREIQNRACDILSKADGKVSFQEFPWQKDIGSGFTMVLENGDKIEKAAVNFSKVEGPYTEQMAQSAGMSGDRFKATGVSSIIHPKNPHAPIAHMNIRYFEIDGKTYWFGGGVDLTPHYIDLNQAQEFHTRVKGMCDKHSSSFYGEFKKWADDYFYNKHRKETRGIGGIFYDHLNEDKGLTKQAIFDFSLDVGRLYPDVYADLLLPKANLSFTKDEQDWQLLRRGRYVEFNLVYDRGTKFGLESGGNTESILLSMPPMSSWAYNHKPEVGTPEAETLKLLKKDVDWLNIVQRQSVDA